MDLGSVWTWLLCDFLFFATSVANLIWGPSRKLLVSRRRRLCRAVRSDGAGGSRHALPVPGRAGAQLDQHRDPVDLVLMATRKSAFNAHISPRKCP